ncbi:hypothetical protein LWI28_027445 [Acer negundo]|uniref:Reverse transcriptase domain-containing protein n=1 Tax=Acer negundo TaxID=4023 RepID=A0AAD5P6D8_ACENE|nr:hypothetical protein LWI28_027445 [Acer negundo]
MPAKVKAVLGEYKDVMLQELPKKIQPRLEVDHQIELKTGAKPLDIAPYCMAPLESEELRNHILHSHEQALPSILDWFVAVYLDDIVVYSQALDEHIQHLKQVFQVLRENELYVKLEKCSFGQQEVEFLGHQIRYGKFMMDGAKVKVVQEWEAPTKMSELRSFLGLVNYYRWFIQGYSAKAAPLIDLLKKNQAWQ